MPTYFYGSLVRENIVYVPPIFREDDMDTLREIMSSAGICQFITATSQGLIATPLPMFLDPGEGEFGVLYGHLAKANSQWREAVIGDALAIFMGPSAYISAGWYPSKKDHHKVVPTWNYESVQVFGKVEFVLEREILLSIVTRLTDIHESRLKNPWSVNDAPESFIQGQLKGIVGIRMPITKIIGKKKMSQNRSDDDRLGVIEALSESDKVTDNIVADIISKCNKNK